MNESKWIDAWKQEESVAHIHGWDFSHIAGRYTEETDLPWDYQRIVLNSLRPEMKLLDVDTGGGEFLLSLHHPYENTSAAEAYPPNVALCRETLLPLGIDFRAAGFTILDAQECFRPIKFYDVGALVWFARIIEWEFPGFSVERCKARLLRAQEILAQNGVLEGRIHRFLLVCSKGKEQDAHSKGQAGL